LLAIFQALSQKDRDTILNPKGTAKLSTTIKGNGNAIDLTVGGPDGVKPLVHPSKGQDKEEQKENNETRRTDAVSTAIRDSFSLVNQCRHLHQLDSSVTVPGPGRPRKVVDPEKAAKVSFPGPYLISLILIPNSGKGQTGEKSREGREGQER
jgi:hypothetical protein